MVDISPKALRFARMAAEQQPSLARDARLSAIRQSERERPSAGPRSGYIAIADDLAAFCLDAVTSLLGDGERLSSNDWDGNDVLFMRSFAQGLREQLRASVATAP